MECAFFNSPPKFQQRIIVFSHPKLKFNERLNCCLVSPLCAHRKNVPQREDKLGRQIVSTCNKEDPPQAWNCPPSTRSALSPPQRKDIPSQYVDHQFINSVMVDKQFQIKILHLDNFLNLPRLQWPAQGLSNKRWISWKEIACRVVVNKFEKSEVTFWKS